MNLKLQLYAACQAYVQQRIDAAQHAMQAAQESANSETKSSAGDKYETGRAMAHEERNRNAVQLQEALKLRAELERIDIQKPFTMALPGALVMTTQGNYFLSISAGKISLEGTDYFAVSPASPIGTQLKGVHAKDKVTFNNRSFTITNIL
ncbi:3-oxoacyl-ACP synthase [Hymenobacter jejuensis]|uniref:3-oxoacyl-ACP synthase n=1 Tax=Hymenobacter jejuensis TaxID=2502781 RepID=A0A5B8A2T1_9BACT|nr:3-oxoacyl-ACP synthase [Hymenobacter jejuensis]QDA61016.1 3-oxoacyl-ACP synthase [Hymenobacter jejuensis]